MEHEDKKPRLKFLYPVGDGGIAVKKKNHGVTLVELAITLSLIGLVLVLGFNLYFLGEKVFSSSSTVYQLQSPIRLTETFVSTEVRNVTEIAIVNVPITPEAGFHYVYLKDNKISYYFSGEASDKTEAIMVDQNIFKIKKDSNGRNFLSVILKGSLKGEVYELNTEILLNNIINQSEAEGKAIKYKKP